MNTRAGRLAWGIFALTIFLIAVAAAIFVYDVAVSGHQPDPNYLGLITSAPGRGTRIAGKIPARMALAAEAS